MKRKNPGKGGAFERQVAKTLSLWLTNGHDKKQLIRSVLSGGWQERDWHQVGDLAPNGPEGAFFRERFALELKHRRDVQFWHFFTSEDKSNTILGWWLKLQEEIDDLTCEHFPTPMLIFRMNFRPIMLGTIPQILKTDRLLTLKAKGVRPLGILPLDDFLKRPPDFYYGLLSGGH